MSTAGVLSIEILAGIARLSEDMKRAERIVGDSTGKMERSVTSLQSQFSKLGIGMSIGLMIDSARRLTDSYTKVTAQMRIATATQAEYAKGMEDVRRISTSAQASVEATTMLYTRLTNSLKQHGATQQDVGRITESVSLGLKAYGATTAEAASAMLQLSQAFGSGRLGGEEFRAVSEAMPNMMVHLAKSMGVPKSALRDLSMQGKITSEVMMKAWNDPALIAGLTKQAEMTRTITGEWHVLRNELTMLVGEFMGASGSTAGITTAIRAMSDSVMFLGKHLDGIVFSLQVMSVVMAGKFAKSLYDNKIMMRDWTEAIAMNAAGKKAHDAAMLASTEAQAAAALASSAAKKAEAAIMKQASAEIALAAEAEAAAVKASSAVIKASVAEVAIAVKAAKKAQVLAEVEASSLSSQLGMNRQSLLTAQYAAGEAQRTAIVIAANAERDAVAAASVAREAVLNKSRIAQSEAFIAAKWVEAHAMNAAMDKQIAATAAATAAETARTGAMIGGLTKALNFVKGMVGGTMGLIGLALWGAYEIADHMGWIDKVFMSAEDRIKKLRAEIASLREIPSQVKGDMPGVASGFAAVPGVVADAVAAYAKGIGDVSKNFGSFIKDGSFIFSKDFLSKEQEKAAKLKELYSTLQSELDKLWAMKNISQANRIAAEIQLRETYIEKVAELNKKEKAIKQDFDLSDAHVKAYQKMLQEEADAQHKLSEQLGANFAKDLEGINAKTAAIELETAKIGLTKEAVDLLMASREADTVAGLKGQLELAKGDEVELARLNLLIDAYERKREAELGQADAHARQAAIAVQTKAHEDMWKKVDGFAHDAFDNIFDKGKNAFEEIGKVIKKSILDMLYRMTVQKWIFNIAGVAGGAGASGSAAASGGGGGGGVGGWLSAGKSIYNILNDGVSTAITEGFTQVAGSSFGQSMGWSTATTNAQGVQMQSLSNSGMAMNAGLTAIGNAAAGYMLQKTISGEYKIGNGKIVDALTLAASAYFGPIAGVVAGVVNRAFGMGAKQSGTTTLAGQFSGEGFAGQYQTPWTQKGGWFRSNRSGVDTQAVAAEQQAALNALVGGTKSVFDNLVAVSGDANKSISGWTFAINRQVATQEQQNQLIIDMADSMGNYLIPSLEQFKLEGENLADTAVRMRDEFILTDTVLRLVGGSFGAVGLASMGARDNLVQLMGGIQSMNTTMQSYYQNFFTDAERHANDLGALTIQFAQLGLSIPQSANDFKLLVSSQDLSTESGRQLFAALMSLNGAFAALIPSAEAAEQAVRDNIKALQDKAIEDYNAARQATDSLRAFAMSVRELQRSLWAGSQSPLSSTYSVARSQFAATNALAGANDTNAQGNLSNAATAFLDVSRMQSTAIEYARDFAMVQSSLEETATLTEDAVTVADLQLEQLRQINTWLEVVVAYSEAQALSALVGTAVTSVGAVNTAYQDQIDAGIAAQSALDAAAAKNTVAQESAALIQVAQPVVAAYSASNPNPANVATKAAALAEWRNAEQKFDYMNMYDMGFATSAAWFEVEAARKAYEALPAFATGINAGILQSDTILQAHGGEEIKPVAYVDRERAAREETNKLLARLQDEVKMLRKENQAGQVAIANNTKKTAVILDKFDGEGMPAVRV